VTDGPPGDVSDASDAADAPSPVPGTPTPPSLPPGPRLPGPRLLFSFTKSGASAYISHLDMMTVFERALARAGVRARFTEGFNPKPRLEFASPLGLGIESEEEIAAVVLEDPADREGFAERMNRALPGGLRVTRADLIVEDPKARRRSLMSLQWGSEYRVGDRTVRLPMGGGRSVRQEAVVGGPEPAPILRLRTLAAGQGGEPASYFDVLCAPPASRSAALS
jgi:hypothetical protein